MEQKLSNRLSALAEKATKGPWKRYYAPRSPNDIHEIRGSENDPHNPVVSWVGLEGMPRSKREIKANVQLIVELVNALPTIISALQEKDM